MLAMCIKSESIFLGSQGADISERLAEKSCLLWQAVVIAKQLVSQIKTPLP